MCSIVKIKEDMKQNEKMYSTVLHWFSFFFNRSYTIYMIYICALL